MSLAVIRRNPWLTGISGRPNPATFFGARSSAVEHLTFNQVVEGSIPSGLTKKTTIILCVVNMVSIFSGPCFVSIIR